MLAEQFENTFMPRHFRTLLFCCLEIFSHSGSCPLAVLLEQVRPRALQTLQGELVPVRVHFVVLVSTKRGSGVRHQVDALHVGYLLDHGRLSIARHTCQHVVRDPYISRIVLRIPN